jgi:hypothetical protein
VARAITGFGVAGIDEKAKRCLAVQNRRAGEQFRLARELVCDLRVVRGRALRHAAQPS